MHTSVIGRVILSTEHPWQVAEKSVNHEQTRLNLIILYDSLTVLCRHCSQAYKLHDSRQHHLRDDKTSGYMVWQHVRVPRAKCPVCGKLGMITYPQADKRARYTLTILLSGHPCPAVQKHCPCCTRPEYHGKSDEVHNEDGCKAGPTAIHRQAYRPEVQARESGSDLPTTDFNLNSC